MSSTSSSPGQERRPTELGPLLSQVRKAAGWKQTDVVARTDLSQAQLSRTERSDSVPSPEQIATLAALYGLDDETTEWMLGVVEDHHTQRNDKRFIVQRGSNILAVQRRFRRLEQRVTRMRSFSMGAVLGMVQTSGYAAAVFGTDESHERVQERLRRRIDAAQNRDRRYELVLAEGVGRWALGSPLVMADQLDDLVAVSQLPNVDLGWLPWSTVTGELPGPGFNIYDDHTVVLSQIAGSATLTDAGDVHSYEGLFTRLQRAALTGDSAREAIAFLAQDYRSLPDKARAAGPLDLAQS